MRGYLPAVITAEEGRFGTVARTVFGKAVGQAMDSQAASVFERIVPSAGDIGIKRFGFFASLEADVCIARGIDNGFAGDGKATAFVFEDDMRNAAIVASDRAEARVVQDGDAVFKK